MLAQADIVIPCLNEEEYIERCVRSLVNQKGAKSPIKIWVVDGGSTDGTLSILQHLQEEIEELTVLHNPKKFTPISMNMGIEAGNAPVVIILGAHAEASNDFIQQNLSTLMEHDEAACVGGLIENIDENRASELISKAMGSSFGVGNATFRTGGQEGWVDTVAFGAYRRSVLDEVGLFDESLVRNQDDELNYRITRNGHKIRFNPAIRSRYFVRGSFAKLKKQYQQYGYWKVYVNQKWKTVTTVRQLFPAAFVIFLFSFFLAFLFPPYAFLYGAVLALYFLLSFAFAMRSSDKLKDVPGIMRCFFILHFYYGWGYLEGMVRFMLLGKPPKTASTSLSR